MKLPHAIRRPTDSAETAWYRSLFLVNLVKRIVDKGDRLALIEFHNHRTLFKCKGSRPLLFTDYLEKLREMTTRRTWIAANSDEVANKAYDLTLDKFNNLPSREKRSRRTKSNSGGVKRKGPNCRLYFKAFLNEVARSFETAPPANEIEEEARAAKIMKGLVSYQFDRSLREAQRRTNPFRSRYNWKVGGRTIYVWLPLSLKGRERKVWLEKHMENPDPLRPGERERIHSIINQHFPRERVVDLNEATDSSGEQQTPPWSNPGKAFEISLAEAVAEEKVANIRKQRESIRMLGEEKLRQLILRIFKDLSLGRYEDKEVAGHFDLKKATFSRFAGSRWLQGRSIPDLWRNTAEVVLAHPIFKEVAISAGVWKEVEGTLTRAASQCTEETSHEQ
jgi:hypothetical protein